MCLTIEERQRTCSYCHVTFPDRKEFSEHWSKCPTRIRAGYIPAPVPEVRRKIAELREQARAKLEEASRLEGELAVREPLEQIAM